MSFYQFSLTSVAPDDVLTSRVFVESAIVGQGFAFINVYKSKIF